VELKKQADLEQSFFTWFGSGLRKTIEDNRRRYRMQLTEAQMKDRDSRSLSALPSTKSTSVVDRAVISALQEYHQDPEAIAFNAKTFGTGSDVDMKSKWLTEIFRYRSDIATGTFPMFTWHSKSLKAGFTDGMECALVWWRKESYTKKVKAHFRVDVNEMGAESLTPVDPMEYQVASELLPESYREESQDQEVIVRDTWWIDALDPVKGEICWDPKAPMLDVNLGQWAVVTLDKSFDEVWGLKKSGVFDAGFTKEQLKTFQRTGTTEHTDSSRAYTDPDTIDTADFNTIPVKAFFYKEDNQWMVQFSLDFQTKLSQPHPVNDVFFAGRQVDRLPVVIGYSDEELWENVGRGLPRIIAPLEDEWSDHRNNFNDYVKQTLRGKYWISPDSDVDVDELINMPVVKAQWGTDAGEINQSRNTLDVLRAFDVLSSDINEVIPAGMENSGRALTPKGTNRTLGAAQLSLQSSEAKLGIALMRRNETFFKPLLYLIAQLEFAFETDETIARIAGSRVKGSQGAQFQVPSDGPVVDFRELDFDVDIQINAGMGAAPRHQKFQNIVQLAQLADLMKIPFHGIEAFRQSTILAGFGPNQFINPTPPEPPKPQVDYKANVSVPFEMLPPAARVFLFEQFMNGQMGVTAKVDALGGSDTQAGMRETMQNGGGMIQPDRTGKTVDSTGDAGQMMSMGGAMNGME
jgi:hypothetical protein